MKNLLSLFLVLIPLWGSSQDKKASSEKKAEKKVEVRMVERADDGSVKNGSIPDSLGGRYFFHDNGKAFKLFPKYEMAVAHYRGYYPRKKKETVKGVVYIEKAPTQGGEAPDEISVPGHSRKKKDP